MGVCSQSWFYLCGNTNRIGGDLPLSLIVTTAGITGTAAGIVTGGARRTVTGFAVGLGLALGVAIGTAVAAWPIMGCTCESLFRHWKLTVPCS